MWDLQYATNYAQALAAEDRLFATFPPDDHFLLWRDERVMGEIHWYGEFYKNCITPPTAIGEYTTLLKIFSQ